MTPEVSQIYSSTKKYTDFMVQELNTRLKEINPALVQEAQDFSRNASIRGSRR